MGHLERSEAAANPIHPELSLVTLSVDVQVGETRLPAGSRGTVVFAYRGGRAYEVEFIEPIATVLTLTADDLA